MRSGLWIHRLSPSTRRLVEETRAFRHRVTAVERDIAEYRDQVTTIAFRVGSDTANLDDHAILTVAEQLATRLDAASEALVRHQQAERLVDERTQALTRADTRVDEAQTALTALLALGGVTDGNTEAFRRRAQIAEDRRTLEAQHRESDLALRQILGPEDGALDALDAALRATSPEELALALESARATTAEQQERRDELSQEQGEVATQFRGLHDDQTASAARARDASLRAELEQAAEQWAQLAVARALLRRTRERYERERQPAVIQRAEQFFRTLTGNRYSRVFQAVGESAVRVEDHDGSQKLPDQLSRGTREQLYLALRLGAIEEASTRHEPLPVIVDDALVNFDAQRARRAAEAFVQLSTRTQVIVFTCHAWMSDLFEDVADSPETLSLDD